MLPSLRPERADQAAASVAIFKGPITLPSCLFHTKHGSHLPSVVAMHSASSTVCAVRTGWDQLKSIIPFGTAKKPSDASNEPEEDKCFTVVFTGNSAIHLMVKNNGRSRDEWIAAFSDLASGLYKEILKPEEPQPE